MVIYAYYKNDNHKITIWSMTEDTCVVQEYRDGVKSKKATAKIKYYNDKPYIICKGHRYYLADFIKFDL
jgi:hypothetical protein